MQCTHTHTHTHMSSHRPGSHRRALRGSPTLVFPVPQRWGRCWPLVPVLLVARLGWVPHRLPPTFQLSPECPVQTCGVVGRQPPEEGLAFCSASSWLKGGSVRGQSATCSECAGAL